MKSMKYMDELNSTETLIQVSAKLPSYSGVKWCRHACERRERTKVVSFSDLVDFVKEEDELATDPVFSPNALMRERNKESNRESPNTPFKGRTPRRPPPANSLLTQGREAGQKSGRPSTRCQLCQKNHQSRRMRRVYEARRSRSRFHKIEGPVLWLPWQGPLIKVL